MALDLARDKLGYGQDQLALLADKVKRGDLTPILEIYEADIKSPVRSAVSGTLLRNLFIQVQKAKVCHCLRWPVYSRSLTPSVS